MRAWLNGDDVIVVNDGIGMDIASLLRHGKRYRHNLNGTDFMPHLLNTLDAPHRVFLLGGRQVLGTCDGYAKRTPEQICAQFEFLSGGVQRAPLWVQKLRMEWFFRLCQEPRRMVRRYTADIAQFLWLCMSYPVVRSVKAVRSAS